MSSIVQTPYENKFVWAGCSGSCPRPASSSDNFSAGEPVRATDPAAVKGEGYRPALDRLARDVTVQRRVTARFAQKDGRHLNVRKAIQPEPNLKAIYDVLGLKPRGSYPAELNG
jgi:hypothetical protein